MKSFYIAEINLPSKSAYAVHVFQMCNAIAKINKKVILIVPYLDKNYSIKIKKEYGIKYNFHIKSIFPKKKELNFLRRIYFAYSCLKFITKEKKNTLIISRSILTSLILAKNKIFSYMEIHHELKSFTKIIFSLYQKNKSNKYLKFILINKYLLNYFKFNKEDYLILDDAVNLEMFKKSNKKIIKNTCAYFGSLTSGKGIEIIKEISAKLKNINFHIYGDLKLLNSKFISFKKAKNVKFFNHLRYNKIPEHMSRYNILLMPYLKNVSVRSKNLNVANYMSPLKLFEYMASGKIIVATNLNVYSHILKNNKNSILIPVGKTNLWVKKIIEIFKDTKKYKYLQKNSLKTVKKYTWDLRVQKILKNFKRFNLN